MMRYLSVCSGISCESVAWRPLGWTPTAFAEVVAFPSVLLAHHYPDVPNLGDLAEIDADAIRRLRPDVAIGGTPCQSFSVAGTRGGLDDDRGNLALQFFRVAAQSGARWLIWENVPGVMHHDSGRTFAAIVGALVECGYGIAWRVLDAQHFGVAQRRRRLFVVGHLGGQWQRAAAVLFEHASLQGCPAPRRSTGARAAGTLGAGSPRSGGRIGGDEAAGGQLVAVTGQTITHTLDADSGGACTEDGTGRGAPIVADPLTSGGHLQVDTARTLSASGHRLDGDTDTFVAYQCHGTNVGPMGTLRRGNGHVTGGAPFIADLVQATSGENRSTFAPGSPCSSLATSSRPVVFPAVRRLTPTEWERLQGLPEGYTAIPYRGRLVAADSPRYKAIGNGMAVPVVRWLGERIELVERVLRRAA